MGAIRNTPHYRRSVDLAVGPACGSSTRHRTIQRADTSQLDRCRIEVAQVDEALVDAQAKRLSRCAPPRQPVGDIECGSVPVE